MLIYKGNLHTKNWTSMLSVLAQENIAFLPKPDGRRTDICSQRVASLLKISQKIFPFFQPYQAISVLCVCVCVCGCVCLCVCASIKIHVNYTSLYLLGWVYCQICARNNGGYSEKRKIGQEGILLDFVLEYIKILIILTKFIILFMFNGLSLQP